MYKLINEQDIINILMDNDLDHIQTKDGTELIQIITTMQPAGMIPVNEKLPDYDTECLVVDADGEYGVGFYRDDVKAWDSPSWGWLERKDRVDNHEAYTMPCGIGKVIAWIPLTNLLKR